MGEELDIAHLMPSSERMTRIEAAFRSAEDDHLTTVRKALGDEFSYHELQLARMSLRQAAKPANTSQEPTAAARPTPRGGLRRRKKVRASPTPTRRTGSLVDRLRSHGLEVNDKRAKGGLLWVIGGPELDELLKEFKEVRFKFSESGHEDTKKWFTNEPQPGWFASDKSI